MDQNDFPDSPPPPPVDEEEEKKRGRAASIGDTSPVHAQLGANMRPDVVSAPGGLHTITTQKSADYRPDLAGDVTQTQDAALDAYITKMLEPESDASAGLRAEIKQELRREIVTGDPAQLAGVEPGRFREQIGAAALVDVEGVNDPKQYHAFDTTHAGVETSNQRAEFAKAHAEYVAYTRDFAAKGDEGAAAWLERNGYEPAPATEAELFYVVEPNSGKPLIAGNPALTPREAVEAYANHYHCVVGETDGKFDYAWPQAGTDRVLMVAEDGDYRMSANSYRELAAQLVEGGDLAPAEAVLARYNEESTQRQENERRARAGEDVDPSADISAYIEGLAREAHEEAKLGRDTEFEQTSERETDGGGPARPRGGGRGFF